MKKSDRIFNKVFKTIEKLKMINKNDRVVAALSGGPDSVFLIYALEKLKKKMDIEVYAFHLHHGLRGEEADRDMIFCRELCEKMDIPIKVYKRDVARYARQQGYSVEEAGHHLRYKLFYEVMDFYKADKVATGHTADDQAETVLLRLLAGAGSKGLAGISPIRNGIIIRPIIEVRKQEILDFLEEENIEYMVDATNSDSDMMRNRIRNKLIPCLKEHFNPKIEENLCRIATIFQEEMKYLDDLTDAYLGRFARIYENRAVLDIEETLSLSPFISKYLVRRLLRRFTGTLKDISFEHTGNIMKLMEGPSGASITLPGGITVEREYRFLVVRFADRENIPPLPEISLNFPGINFSEDWEIQVAGEVIEEVPPLTVDNPYSIFIDYDECRNKEFKLRPRKKGDRFSPLGMEGSKKLKDFFIDMKVPRRLRDSIPLILCGDDIVWIAYYRQSDIYRVTDKTKRVLNLRIEKISGDI